MKRYYIAIPDIHGMIEELRQVLYSCDMWVKCHLSPDDEVTYVFLGDYIDRGPDSKAVLALVREYVLLKDAICLIGNHDKFLIGTGDESYEYFPDLNKHIKNSNMWQDNNGLKTCVQMFGVQFDTTGMNSVQIMDNLNMWQYVETIRKSEEYEFLKEFGKYYHETKHIFFCHAPQSQKKFTETSLIWGHDRDDRRKPETCFMVPNNKLMSVHGHIHRLEEKINFPRIVNYNHGGLKKTVILADSGCGCGENGVLHPVIIRETPSKPEILAIL